MATLYYTWSTLSNITWILAVHAVSITPNCSVSTDNLGRFVYDCRGHYFAVFPSNIPNNTLVLLLRRTMNSPTVPSFQTIGLEKLQVLDLSWNAIYKFTNDTFKDMTSLISLDLRGNFGFAPVVPDGLFTNLINLRRLQINGGQFLFESSKNFVETVKSLQSLDSFVFYNGDIKFGIQIASQLTNLTSQEFRECNNDDMYTLAQLLDQLRNLTKLNSITIVSCDLHNVGNITSLDWMYNVKNINLACNFLNIIETISFLGNQSSLSHLDTLILNRIDKKKGVFGCHEIAFNSNIFCNLSFSSSLKRLSIQKIRLLYYEAALFRCLQNLRSISVGHNTFIDILDDGRFLKSSERLPVALKWFTSVYYIKISSIMNTAMTKEVYCDAEDNTFNQYFIDESQFQFQKQSKECEGGNMEIKQGYIKLPSCLRALQIDHSASSFDDSGIIPPVGITFSSNNSLELLDLSHSVYQVNGLFINALRMSGLHKLRIMKLRHMNIKRFYMVTINHAENLYDIDLSDNRFGQMTGKQLSQMFIKPLNIKKLNLSFCDIVTVNDDFLRQFPQITFLDLSNNKLSNLPFNLSWLISSDSLIMDLSFNQISTADDIFLESIKLLELHRPITLKLSNNQFRCDCNTLNFLKWFQSTISVIDKKENITCSYRGENIALVAFVDVDDLEFQCTKFTRILYISLGSVLSITTVGIILGVLLFRYRWHIRWYWFRFKHKMRRKQNRHEDSLLSAEHVFACYVNYLGVTDEWIIKEMVTPLENLDIGNVFILARNAAAGLDEADAIKEAINKSRKLLYVVGNEEDVGETSSFLYSLRLALIERIEDIIIVFKEVAVFERLLLKAPLPRRNKKNPIKHIQYEANDVFWDEIRLQLNNNFQENIDGYGLLSDYSLENVQQT